MPSLGATFLADQRLIDPAATTEPRLFYRAVRVP